MNPKYVHLKRRPSYIKNNPDFMIQDYALICTPKRHNAYPFRYYDDKILNDPLVLNMFEKSSDDLKDRSGRTVSEQFSFAPRIYNTFGNFFGFYNVTSFMQYMTMLYVITYEHNDAEIRAMALSELDDLSEIIFVQAKHYSNGEYNTSVHNIYEAFRKNTIDLSLSTYEFFKNFVNDERVVINTVGSKENKYFGESIEVFKGNAHIYLTSAPQINSSLDIYKDRLNRGLRFFQSNPTIRTLSRIEVATSLNKPLSKNSNLCLQLSSTKNSDFFNNYNSTNPLVIESLSMPSVMLESISFLNKMDKPPSLDDKKSEIVKLYNGSIESVIKDVDVNAQFVGDMEEYEYYRLAILEQCKRINVKPVFNKELLDTTKYRFKVKIDYTPKNTDAMFKVFKWIAEVSSEAIISNSSFPLNSGYVKSYENLKNINVAQYIARKKEEHKHDQTILDNYVKFSKRYFKGTHLPAISNYNYTQTIQVLSEGLLEHDDEILRILCEARYNDTRLTISMTCDDIKVLRKIKLLGASIREVNFHFIDRKEVLEYFKNY